MALPTKAKSRLEGIQRLMRSPSSTEVKAAGVLMREVANDTEVAHDIRQEASVRAGDLSAPPTSENASRREEAMARAFAFCVRNV